MTGGDWVPGGESRRTASGPEGSSAKAFLSGAQDNLVTIGHMGTFFFMSRFPVTLNRFLLLVLAVVSLSSLLAARYLLVQADYVIYDGTAVLTVSGHHTTVAEVLTAANVALRPEDIIQPSPGEPARPGTPIRIQRARSVTLRTAGSGTRTLWTQQTTLAGLLAEAGIAVRPDEPLFVNGAPVTSPDLAQVPLPAEVEIGRFHTITIRDGQSQQLLRTAAQTVGQALQEAGIVLTALDGVSPPADEQLTPDAVIQVRRAMPLSIHVDGRVIQTRSHQPTIQAAIAEAGIPLAGSDYTQPVLDTPLHPGLTVFVIRVTEDFRVVDEPIPYQTLWQVNDQLDLDTQAVITPGEPGIMRRRLRVRYENGREVGHVVDGEWVAKAPVNEVIGYGTRITTRLVQTPEGPREYWRVVRMRVTSYTAATSGKERDDPAYGITASGYGAGKGLVAVDRSIVPFGSYVYVPGYGVAYVGDTGDGVRGRWIDLGYDEANFRPWSGYVDVYYLTPVPPTEDINYLLPAELP